MHSTNYVLGFVLAMTVLVAVILAGLSSMWKEASKENEAIFNKRGILLAVKNQLGGLDPKTIPDDKVLAIFDKQVKQLVLDMDGNELSSEEVIAAGYNGGRAEDVDMAKEKKKPEGERILPLFIFNSDKGKFYILSVRGNGLWDEIWGNVALESDFNTLAGAAFDHKGETPGLGAEIKDNPSFYGQFSGEKIFNASGEYVSVDVVKGGARPDDVHGVDGLSGATVTADGVAEMLDRGISYYLPYIEKQAGDKKMGLN